MQLLTNRYYIFAIALSSVQCQIEAELSSFFVTQPEFV